MNSIWYAIILSTGIALNTCEQIWISFTHTKNTNLVENAQEVLEKIVETVVIKIHFNIDPTDKKVVVLYLNKLEPTSPMVAFLSNFSEIGSVVLENLFKSCHCICTILAVISLGQILPKDDLRKFCCNWSCISYI